MLEVLIVSECIQVSSLLCCVVLCCVVLLGGALLVCCECGLLASLVTCVN